MTDKVSVVICCYNSEQVIEKTVQSLVNQSLEKKNYEIIIVDNNCADSTVAIAEDILKSNNVDFQILKEAVPGLMNARICGTRAVKYNITLFVDDDNILEENFLEKLLKIYELKTDVGAVGVQVKPLVHEETPSWFYNYLGVYACGKQASSSQDVTQTRMTLFGAGLSFRTKIIQEILLTKNKLFLMGRTENSLLRGDDSELCMRCILLGWKIWYEENLILEHNILPHRISWNYIKGARLGGGMASTVLDIYRTVNLENIPRSYCFDFLNTCFKFLKLTLQDGYRDRDTVGSNKSFEYYYLKGRIKGFLHFGPIKISKMKKQIRMMR